MSVPPPLFPGYAAKAPQMPPAAAAKFISPTQGLASFRPGGGTMQSNAENVGGRFLIRTQMQSHKQRMRHIRPVISIEPPWGHDHALGSAGASATVRPSSGVARKLAAHTGRPASASQQRSSPSRAAHQHASSTAGSPPSSSEPPIDVAAKLTTEEQTTFRSLVRLLCELSNEDARALLHQAYADSEERRLLDQYSGVLPRMQQEIPPPTSSAPPPAGANTAHPQPPLSRPPPAGPTESATSHDAAPRSNRPPSAGGPSTRHAT